MAVEIEVLRDPSRHWLNIKARQLTSPNHEFQTVEAIGDALKQYLAMFLRRVAINQ